MSDLTTILAQVLADHRVNDTSALRNGVATWETRCSCGRYEQTATYGATREGAADAVAALPHRCDDARRHVAQMLAAAVHRWNDTAPRIEIHVNQPGPRLLR